MTVTHTGPGPARSILRAERSLVFVLLTAAAFMTFGAAWLYDPSPPARYGALFVWLFLTIAVAAYGVVRHADALAVKLGEPYGTLILTLSVITIEVLMIASVMLTGGQEPTLARDTMFAICMIVMNGLVGVSLLYGGAKHHEQEFNLQGANAYLAVIVPLAILGLVEPNFTTASAAGTLSTWQAVLASILFLGMYGIFLAIQTMRHRSFFTHPGASAEDEHDHHDLVVRSLPFHVVLLLAYMVPVVLLAKKLAIPLDYGITTLGAPTALGGFLVALLVLWPEAVSGMQAAGANRLQRAVNIYLGSAAATIGLTIPAVLVIGLATGATVVLGLEMADVFLLLTTILVSFLTFASQRTNVLHGAVHVLLFLVYLGLIFD